MDYKQMTAPCGLDCFNCPVYLANDNQEIRKELAQKMGIKEEEAVCKGCRNEKGLRCFIGLTDPCETYTCTEKKGIHNCGECNDFPCEQLYPHADKAADCQQNTKAFNCCLIKQIGIEKWAKEKAKIVRDTYFMKKL